MNIYDNNKQLLAAMGNADNYSTDFEVRKAILDALGGDSSKCYSIYEVDKQILKIYLEGGGGTGGGEKVKVKKIEVSNDCIVDGYWPAENIDTSNVTSMSSMFYNCSSLQTLDVSNFDTSKVTNMGSMFGDCSSLQTLDVSGFDTSNVTNMGGMFSRSSLQTLDLSNWDTSNVTNMSSMFSNCSSLQTLDVSGFDTSKVTNMSSMFSNCSSLQTLDVSGFDTSKVTNMYYMFRFCSALQTLDVSGWDTSKVTDMGSMFGDCSSLQTLDVSGWDTSKVTNMSDMFSGCSSITQLDVSGWDASNVKNYLYNMFGDYNNNISNLVGGKSLGEIIANNIGILNGVKVNLTVNGGTVGIDSFLPNVIDSASIRALMNGIADLTGQTSKTIRLSDTVKAKLTEEDIAIATAKNWTIS